MTQEQKEKAYDEALERAKKLKETCDSTAVIGWCEYIFPELKESEDEKIRKYLMERIISLYGENSYTPEGIKVKDIIGWLESKKRLYSDYEESELRRGLLWHLKELQNIKESKGLPIKTKATYDDWIVWLEKQRPITFDSTEDEEIRKALVALVEWAECFSSSAIDSDTAKQMIGWIGVRDVEYTRTNAFIEKAWDWIEDNLLSSNQQDKSRLYFEQFKNYIKE